IDTYIAAVVRCAPPANKPLPGERDNCLPYLQRELPLLKDLRVIVCLGSFALDGLRLALGLRPRPKFGHLAETTLPDGRTIICSFHPSQQNTFTGKLTETMFDAVFARAKVLIDAR
ncbi:MAG: uracil-DNA glycosylase family protein, partial [Chloroflexota bacterium]